MATWNVSARASRCASPRTRNGSTSTRRMSDSCSSACGGSPRLRFIASTLSGSVRYSCFRPATSTSNGATGTHAGTPTRLSPTASPTASPLRLTPTSPRTRNTLREATRRPYRDRPRSGFPTGGNRPELSRRGRSRGSTNHRERAINARNTLRLEAVRYCWAGGAADCLSAETHVRSRLKDA